MDKNAFFESYISVDENIIKEIRELEKITNDNDGTNYQLFVENKLNSLQDIPFLFTYRVNGKLICVLLTFFPDVKEIEVYGFTHPKYRRKGHFGSLLDHMAFFYDPLQSDSMLFVSDTRSLDGQQFVKKYKALLFETEYSMEINWKKFSKYYSTQTNPKEFKLKMIKGTIDLLDPISNIAHTIYGKGKEKSLDFVRNSLLDKKRDQYCLLCDQIMIGICTIGREDDFLMISGMAIDKEYQSRGFGRQFLNRLINSVQGKCERMLKLEVSSVNKHALELYISMGFEKKESYGYYKVVK